MAFKIPIYLWFGLSILRIEWKLLDGLRGSWDILISRGAHLDTRYLFYHWKTIFVGLTIFLLTQIAYIGVGYISSNLVLGKRLHKYGLLIALPIGWGISATLIMGISLLGLVNITVLYFLIIIFFGVGIYYLMIISRHKKDMFKRIFSVNPWFLGLLIVVAGMSAIAAMAPEIEGDVLCIHYGIPLQILKFHKITEMPFTAYDDYPLLWEMLVLPLLGLGGEALARFFGLLLIIFLAQQVYFFARRFVLREWAMVSAALVITNPFLGLFILVAKNDLMVAVLGMAALTPLLIEDTKPDVRRVFLAGILAGFMFSTKYSGGYLVPAFVSVLYISGSLSWRTVTALVAGFVSISLPLFSRNMLNTGDPLFPFGSILFNSPYSNAISRKRLLEHAAYVTIQDPSQMTFWVKVRNALGLFPASDESFLRWLMLIPTVLFIAWKDWRAKAIVSIMGISVVLWFLGPAPVRYGIYLFPLGFVLCVMGLKEMEMKGRILAIIAIFFQIIHLTTSTKLAGMINSGLGFEKSEVYLEKNLSTYYEAVESVNEKVSSSNRILGIGTNRISMFSCRMDYSAFSGPVNPFFKLVHESRTEEDIKKHIHQYRWNYLLYNSMNVFYWRRVYADDNWTERDLALWGSYWSRHAEPIWESSNENTNEGYFYLFDVNKKNRKVKYYGLLPGLEGYWYLIQDDLRHNMYSSALTRIQSLRNIVGEYGIVKYFDWGALQGNYSYDQNYYLLDSAYKNGFSNYSTLKALCIYSDKIGRHDIMETWMMRALKRNPDATRESILREINGL